MTRWAIVLLLIGLVGASLIGVRVGAPDQGPSDEIVVYEVTAARPVEVGVPARIERVLLTSWFAFAPEATYDPARPYAYALDIELVDSNGVLLRQEREEAASRVSGDPDAPLAQGRFGARLAESSAWVTDARSRGIDLSAFGGRRGILRIRAVGERPVLVRLAHSEARSSLARAWKERTLDARERARVVSRRSALGFTDLPEGVRALAVGTWGRRLTARGRAGADFVSRRLLVGDARDEAADPHAPAAVVIGPERVAVFNFSGPVTVRVDAPPRTEIAAAEGALAPVTQVVGESGQVEFNLREAAPRTVRFSADRPVGARFAVNASDAARVLGQGLRFPRGSYVEIQPDVLRHRCFALGPGEPLAVDVFPGQDRVGVTVRGLAEGTGTEPLPVELVVNWIGPGDPSPPQVERASLARSTIDRLGSSAVSEPRAALLRVPAGAVRMELSGSPSTLVSVWSREPDAGEALPKPGYDVELPPELTFRYAPREPRSWATLLPVNATALAAAGREVRVELLPRIESIPGPGPGLVLDRPLTPRGAPVARRLLSPLWFSAGARFESYFLAPLTSEPTHFTIPGDGARAGRIALLYRADEARLGEELRVLVDGRVAARRTLAGRRGELELEVSPGDHQLAVEGLGLQGLGLLDAPPSAGGEIARSRWVVRLLPGRAESFRFDWRQGEIGSLRLVFVTEGGSAPFRVAFAVDRGRAARGPSGLLRRITELEGTLGDRTGLGGRGLLWEAPTLPGEARWPAALAAVRIPLGDDLAPGEHELTLKALPVEGGKPLWVRGVVLGRAEDPAEVATP